MAWPPSSPQRIPLRSILSLIRFLHAPSTQPLAIGSPCFRYESYLILSLFFHRYLAASSSLARFSAASPRTVALHRIPFTTWLTSPRKTRSVCLCIHAVASWLPSGWKQCATCHSLSSTCSRSRTRVTAGTTPSSAGTIRLCSARSPSHKATCVLLPAGSARFTSAATEAMTSSLPESRSAHTRLCSGGCGGFLRWRGCFCLGAVRNRLSRTSSAVRTRLGCVRTAATVARRFLFLLSPLFSRALRSVCSGLTMEIGRASCRERV